MNTIKSILIAFCIAAIFANVSAQQTGFISGKIIDKASKQNLPGVNISVNDTSGTSTDLNGNFSIKVEEGTHSLTITYIGYKTVFLNEIEVLPNDSTIINVELEIDEVILDELVFTASKYGKTINEETVSLELIKPQSIRAVAAQDIKEAINIVPGAYVMDGQINIRGGTGFSYGAGARVQMVVDDLPMISADRGDIRWNLIPLETMEQMEVIKGANSVQYGSAALNGILQVRTIWPSDQPKTNVSAWTGSYFDPKNNATIEDVEIRLVPNDTAINIEGVYLAYDSLTWWNSNRPVFSGAYFGHSQKFGKNKKWDLVIGGAAISKKSHLQGETEDYLRGNLKLRYRINENLSLGVSANGNLVQEGIYLLWEDSAKLSSLPNANDFNNYRQSYVDPFLNYFDPWGNQHKILSRWYNINTVYDPGSKFAGKGKIRNFEYRFYRPIGDIIDLSAGILNTNFSVTDNSLANSSGNIWAPHLQLDIYPIENLSLSLGSRIELFDVEGFSGSSLPIYKGGINYAFTNKNSIRASFGQGFRFPSLSERFLQFNVGAINFFSNEFLEPERGWNADLGYKHKFKISNWNLTADAALFVSEYENLTEASYDLHLPDSINLETVDDTTIFILLNDGAEYLGWKFLNLGEARVAGYELSFNANGNIGAHNINFLGGYTYTFPVSLRENQSLKNWGNYLNQFFKPDTTAFARNLLKYRYRHLAKFDLEYGYKKLFFGLTSNYYSFLDRIDEIFVGTSDVSRFILLATGNEQPVPGIVEFRNANNNGDWIWGARFGFKPSANTRITLLGKNIFNKAYTIRPAKLEAPANITLQFLGEF